MNLNLPHYSQNKDYTCGPACLRMILSYYGKDYSEKELERLLTTTQEKGTKEENLIKISKKLGFKTTSKINGTLQEIEKNLIKNIPVLIVFRSWNEGHFSVISGFTKTHFILHDPAKKGVLRTIRKDLFLKRWKAKYNKKATRWYLALTKK